MVYLVERIHGATTLLRVKRTRLDRVTERPPEEDGHQSEEYRNGKI